MKFKRGDRVKVIDESAEQDKHLIGMIGKIVSLTEYVYHVDFGKKIEQTHNKINSTTHTFYEKELKMNKNQGSLKKPTHLVIWEEDSDPVQFFTSEKAALKFMDELEENNDVVKGSVILIEIKSAQVMAVKKIIALEEYKI